MRAAPRLTIGLPVYNGENYLAESLEALLGQSYEDFELVISDNASTDGTADICHRYGKQDSRIRYIRQPRNIGLQPNHNFVITQARGELFKMASHDDLYARDLLKRCVDALDEHPEVVIAHCWEAMIDTSGNVTKLLQYSVAADSPRAPERFRSMLFDGWDDYTYGVMRAEVLRRTRLHGSHHFADRTINTELGLQGPFHMVPEWLYFRRDHPERTSPYTVRTRCAYLDPRRADRLRNPARAPVRRVHLGLCRGHPERAAVPRRPQRVLPVPGPVASQPGPAGRRPLAKRRSPAIRRGNRRARSRDLGERARGRPGAEGIMTVRKPTANRARSVAAPRVGLFGHLGACNIGNDASMEAVLRYLRANYPGAIIDAMCPGPERVSDQYGIGGVRMVWYQKYEQRVSGMTAVALKILGKGIDTGRTASWVRRHDVVIVPGAGVLEASLPLWPWGMPYAMFLLSGYREAFRDEGRPGQRGSGRHQQAGDPVAFQLRRQTRLLPVLPGRRSARGPAAAGRGHHAGPCLYRSCVCSARPPRISRAILI